MFDVIIIGARCAGSPTAMLLARRGYDVLLVDRARFPSNQPMSTHLVWLDGGQLLDDWGLLDAAVAGCPPSPSFFLDLGPLQLTGRPVPAPSVSAAFAPRRTTLDHVLVEAAVRAGAELREQCTLDDLVVEDGRVVGARLRTTAGVHTERATIVVGADGLHSRVADLVDAPTSLHRPPLQGTWWSYWGGVDCPEIQLYLREGNAVYVYPTSEDLALVGVSWRADAYGAVHGRAEQEHASVVGSIAPALANQLREGERAERWYTGSVANIVRRAYGPGWALVGDAGCIKDPCTARGINDAFRDAALLSTALHEALSGRRSFPDALAEYERLRDEHTLPTLDFACQLATLDTPPPEMLALFAAMATDELLLSRFLGILAGTVTVPDFFAPQGQSAVPAG